jgi:hypothetical protein
MVSSALEKERKRITSNSRVVIVAYDLLPTGSSRLLLRLAEADALDTSPKGNVVHESIRVRVARTLLRERLRNCVHTRLKLFHVDLLTALVAREEGVLERLDESVLEDDVGVPEIVQVDGVLAPSGYLGQIRSQRVFVVLVGNLRVRLDESALVVRWLIILVTTVLLVLMHPEALTRSTAASNSWSHVFPRSLSRRFGKRLRKSLSVASIRISSKAL